MSVMSEINWDDFSTVLAESAKDQQLLNMMFWLDGWKEAYSKAGLSHSAVRLVELLESPYFDVFNDKMFYVGSGGSRVNIGLLATWLARRSAEVGGETALQDVRRLIEEGRAPLIDVLVLAGIEVDGVYDVGGGFKLVPLSHLGEYDILHFGKYLYSGGPAINDAYPSAALVSVSPAVEYAGSTNQMGDNQELYADQELFRLVLCLLSSGGAPTPLGRWSLLPQSVPFSGCLDGRCTYALEIKHSKVEQGFSKNEIEIAIDLYGKLKLFSEKARAPIVIALNRLSQSMNTWDSVQQVIDLGVALESVLVGETTDQLSYQFRLMGALLTGDTLEERKRSWDVFKAIYTLRSKAVHNGILPNTRFNVYGEQQKLSCREVVLEGSRLGRKAILAIIEMGGITAEEYTSFILSAGGRVTG